MSHHDHPWCVLENSYNSSIFYALTFGNEYGDGSRFSVGRGARIVARVRITGVKTGKMMIKNGYKIQIRS